MTTWSAWTSLLALESASTFAHQVDWVNWFITWVSLFFLVLITAVMIYFVLKYRRIGNRAAEQTATHNTPLELTWSVIPLILVIVMFYLGLVVYGDMRTTPLNAYVVNVEARKWDWEFTHPNGALEVNELTVPVDRPVRLVMESQDVLHSLYVPAFRVKQDVVPGRRTTLWFHATRTNTLEEGGFDLFCAEYCGAEHSSMLARVYVYPEDAFQTRIKEIADWIKDIDEEALWYKAGPRIYNRCKACHSVEEGVTLIGPSFWETHDLLTSGGERRLRDGRTVTVDENYISSSIRDPNADVVEGLNPVMSMFNLSAKEMTAVTEFIRNLDKFDLSADPPVPLPEFIPSEDDSESE